MFVGRIIVQNNAELVVAKNKFPFFLNDILAETIPPRKGRHNPRVIKKPRSKFPSKKPIHRETSLQQKQPTFSIFNSV